jgi:hypothetical protein
MMDEIWPLVVMVRAISAVGIGVKGFTVNECA